MDYLIKKNVLIENEFVVTSENVLKAIDETNKFIKELPESLFRSIDYKTTGSVMGALFCDKLVKQIDGAMVNPIEKGHPDIIPSRGSSATEEQLRNYPVGLEIKGTIGGIVQGSNLRAGQRRINSLTGITWQAHHREVTQLMSFLWDFNLQYNNFLYPSIVGVFHSSELCQDDWGEISGTEGRNTKVSGMLASGKIKMGKGWIILLNKKEYLDKIQNYLHIESITE